MKSRIDMILERIANLPEHESLCISRPGFEDGRVLMVRRRSGLEQASVHLPEGATAEQVVESLERVL